MPRGVSPFFGRTMVQRVPLSDDEQDLFDSLTTTPPSNGWTAKCADSTGGKQATIDARVGAGKLPAAEVYNDNASTYTDETPGGLFTRLGFCSGSINGVIVRKDLEVALMEDVLANPGNYTDIGTDTYNVLDTNGHTDLPADGDETAAQFVERLSLVEHGGALNSSFAQSHIDARQNT